MTRVIRLWLGSAQIDALSIYVIDPSHVECPWDHGARVVAQHLDGRSLVLSPGVCDVVADRLTEGSNSADEDGYSDWARALANLSGRVRREGRGPQR